MNTSPNRLTRLVLCLSLGLGLVATLLCTLAGVRLPIAQASSPVSAEPITTSTAPNANEHNVPVTSSVSITFFDEPIDLASVTTRTFAVFGSQSPIFTGTYSLSNLSHTVTLDPVRAFFPGELVAATISTGTLNITGEQATSATVWQFRAAVGGGSGLFVDTAQSLGNEDSTDVALGDLDGDGDLDAFVTNLNANAVWQNDGTGAFARSWQSPNQLMSTGVALGDLDFDGDLDAFVVNDMGEKEVWHNDGTGTFTITQNFANSYASGVALGDLDGDGDLDAFVTNDSGYANEIWLNEGMGSFIDSGQSLGSSDSTAVALGDLNGDGDLDAFVTNEWQANTVWINEGAGNFILSQWFGSESSQDVTLGDVDGDGDLDALIVNWDQTFSDFNEIWLNDGGAFTDSGQALDSDNYCGGTLGDVDGDGDLDAYIAYCYGDDKLWLNDGGGVFTDSLQSLGGTPSADAVLGDLVSRLRPRPPTPTPLPEPPT